MYKAFIILKRIGKMTGHTYARSISLTIFEFEVHAMTGSG